MPGCRQPEFSCFLEGQQQVLASGQFQQSWGPVCWSCCCFFPSSEGAQTLEVLPALSTIVPHLNKKVHPPHDFVCQLVDAPTSFSQMKKTWHLLHGPYLVHLHRWFCRKKRANKSCLSTPLLMLSWPCFPSRSSHHCMAPEPSLAKSQI